MKKVSNEFINLSKKVKIQDLKLTINDGELTVQEVHLMPVNIFNAIPISRLRERKQVIAKELKYSFEGQLFKTIMQQIEITVKNASEIKGKYVDFQYGIQINNEFEYVDMGEYYIKDVEDDKNKEELVVTGYDKMLNFMKPFKQSDLKLTYPCKMGKLVNKMGEVCGVELYSTNFFNSDLIVDEDFFTVQELTYRDVLEKVAQATLTTIFIKEGKLYLCKVSDSVQTLNTSFLSDLVIGEKFGPVNALVLGRGNVEDNIEASNKESIAKNGRCEIRFDENEFVDSKREDVIDLMLEQIDGLEYYAIEASNLGLLWLEPCDVITVKDREESEYKSIYLKASVTINTGIKGEMQADIPEETTTEYKVTTKEEKKTLKVERLAKKNEGLIQDIIEENAETSTKLSQHEQTIDSMKDTIKSVEIKADTAQSTADSATTKANNAQTSANNAQTTANTANKNAQNAQTTADTANTNAQNAQKTADANTTKITTTTTKLAEVEKTVDGITQSVSAVEEKVETVESTANSAKTNANTALTTANTAKSTADAVNTNLTTNYYTKTETNAQIQTKADSITTSVTKEISTAKSEAINSANSSTDEKLKDYSTTSQMNSIIEQTANEITQKIEQIEDLTNEVEGSKSITLENCVEGDLLELHIYGNNTVFEQLYPSDTLYPSDDLYPYGDSRIVVTYEDGTSAIYELGVLDVLRQNREVQDEYILEKGQAKVIRRVNKSGTKKTTEETEVLGSYSIKLKEGTNVITIQSYTAKLSAKFAIKNDYTEIFATRVEMNSSITQTANEINLKVEEKLDEETFTGANIMLAINNDSSSAVINAEKISLNGKNIDLTSDNMSIESTNFKVDKDGNMECVNGKFNGVAEIIGGSQTTPKMTITTSKYESTTTSNGFLIIPNRIWGFSGGLTKVWITNGTNGGNLYMPNGGEIWIRTDNSETTITENGITTPYVTQTSREESKKNFEKLQSGLDIVNNTEIYKYNLKSQTDGDKKHIGFVIGKNYKYSNEITAIDNEGKEVGVDTYSMISVAYKAIQEQQELIKQLQEKIKELEEK